MQEPLISNPAPIEIYYIFFVASVPAMLALHGFWKALHLFAIEKRPSEGWIIDFARKQAKSYLLALRYVGLAVAWLALNSPMIAFIIYRHHA